MHSFCSFFGYIFLHMLMYAGDIYFWKRYRVNYSFIFGLKQGTELGYREVLLLSSALAVLTFSGALSNLDMEMDPRTKSFRALTEVVPLGLLIVSLISKMHYKFTMYKHYHLNIEGWSFLWLQIVILITFCPFNIIYRSSRFFIIKCALHCICSPLYKVPRVTKILDIKMN